MSNFVTKIKKFWLAISIVIIGVLITGYFVWSKNGNGQEEILVIEKGDFVQTISVSGKVIPAESVELGFNKSGKVTQVPVSVGQKVVAGQLIAEIDSRSAAIDLENARIALAKLVKPADKLDIIQAENALKDAEESKIQAYSDGLNYIDETFVHFSDIMLGLDLLLKDSQANSPYFSSVSLFNRQDDTMLNYRKIAVRSYNVARDAYDDILEEQQKVSRNSSDSSIKSLVEKTSQTSKLVAQALKDANIAVSYVVDQTENEYRTDEMTVDLGNLSVWISQITTDVANLNSANDLLNSVDRTITEKAEALSDLIDGPDNYDIQTAKLTVEQKSKNYDDYFLRAPFAGVITRLDLKVGESAVAGQADVSMDGNGLFQIESFIPEVYIANLKVGNPAEVTLDAYGETVAFSAKIISIDPAETIKDGISTYKTKLQFLAENPRIKSGMTANLLITSLKKTDTISLPQGAIIDTGGEKTVQVKVGEEIITKSIELGETGALGLTEIISGLKVGDKVILNPITN